MNSLPYYQSWRQTPSILQFCLSLDPQAPLCSAKGQKKKDRRMTTGGFKWLGLEVVSTFLSKLNWPEFNYMGLTHLKER